MMLANLSNHLLQSTIFGLLAGLLTLTVRKEHARVRYWIWFAASMKFLVPFVWLSALGKQITSLAGFGAVPGHRLYIAIQVIAGATPPIDHRLASQLPWLVAGWICGIVSVAAWYCVRWRKATYTVKHSASLFEGREAGILRRVESKLGIRRPISMVRSTAAIEPGVFGILRPVLMWPERLSHHLVDQELEAILTHEARHVQRSDNLTAALHMMVEAIFWFHPLVWWVGARLVEEREHACDEDVLALGSKPQAYAASILKVCEFCLTSPLACMSGVAGGDLKKRMVSIMKNRELHELGFGKKLALGVVALTTIAAPVAVGLIHASEARGESDGRSMTIASSEQNGQHASVQASKKEMMGLIVKKVNPHYPDAARKAHIQGEVVLRATVGTKGDVENLQVVSGPPELSPAAIEAVKQWKYRPYLTDGRAMEVETDITVNFTLME